MGIYSVLHFAPVWLSNTSNAHITACQQTPPHLCSWAECISSVFTWQSISKIGPSKAANPTSLAGKDKRLVCQKCSQDKPHFLQSFAQANLQETSSVSFMIFSIFISIQSSNLRFIVTRVCFTKTKQGVHAKLMTYGSWIEHEHPHIKTLHVYFFSFLQAILYNEDSGGKLSHQQATAKIMLSSKLAQFYDIF